MGEMIGYVEGADIYLIIALLIFILVFVGAAIYLAVLSKEQAEEIANLPLSNSNKESHEN